MTEALFGIKGKDFVLMAADSHAAFSICRLKDDNDKLTDVEGMLFGAVGPNSDTVNFIEFIDKNIRLNTLRTGYKLTTKAAANFTRNELAHALRNGPYQVDLLVGGVDAEGPALYFMDYLASCEKVNKAAHGYGAYFALSIMDRYYKNDLTLDEAKDIIRKCIEEMKTRFVIHMGSFKCKVVTKDGVSDVDL
mmetsp:Transcript_39210/g.92312  ORF Transcript_39210/g.92312 Transcript_39210/m.92312 type:complete len:192 (+) Transcript_39210:88-663(+)|eukprot:CAMPEP_0178401394 /NCGR_PEP_ID=MMETSP0689_2-20121128/16280_1 /TAXON_ID=160604 /ORGANISM="Amphidinium massartii, Strain CS-259" /LENGTH=191 /DNA_ID=CAMNT_0020022215 /DNA_START=88 /DNA_END=663 /DNA_ORIENTATION=-